MPKRYVAVAAWAGVAAFLIVNYLFWRGVWFGRALETSELTEYLESGQPRKLQHALAEIVRRMEKGDQGVRRWYGHLVKLASHPSSQVRATAAWAMGHDPRSPLLHEELSPMLEDTDPMVRRNVALALVSFGDASGAEEIRQMLRPHTVPSGVVLSADPAQVFESLRALYLIGVAQDAALVEPFVGDERYSRRIRRQASLTLRAIRGRAQAEAR